MTIRLDTIKKIKDFALISANYKSDINVKRGRYVVDGKSIMGLFSMATYEPIEVEILSDNEEEKNKFYEEMKGFE